MDVGSGLVVDGSMLVQGYQAGNLGLNMTAAVADVNPVTTRDIVGDRAPMDGDPATAGVQLQYDSLGNVVTDPNSPEPNRADTLYDSAGNDRIISGGGADLIYATRGGDDIIEAGAGRDRVDSGAGADVMSGGAEGDILAGGADDDRMYADSPLTVEQAIALGNLPNTGIAAQGDWLAGGSGDDTLVGSAARDVLSGGGGTDLLIGGAGDDDLLGDRDWVASRFDWTVTNQAGGVRYYYPTNEFPAMGAADVIYAGEGNDFVSGHEGHDVLFGEGGADILNGGLGNDISLGGAGEDYLFSGAGHDYLDGGAGDDRLEGQTDDDLLVGGAGVDTLIGGAGHDTYIFNRGDGGDTLIDSRADTNSLRFGAGISSSDITLRLSSLMLDLGNGDAVHIQDFNQDDVFNSSSINRFEFEDGTVLTTAELLARGFDLDGTAGDDTIIGTNTTDRISGFAGHDQLQGGDGDDVLDGGLGHDLLFGEGGHDTLLGGAGDEFPKEAWVMAGSEWRFAPCLL